MAAEEACGRRRRVPDGLSAPVEDSPEPGDGRKVVKSSWRCRRWPETGLPASEVRKWPTARVSSRTLVPFKMERKYCMYCY